MKRLPFYCSIISFSLLIGLAAQADVPTLRGVWRGTLGKQSVVACFDPPGTVLYYYLRHRQDLTLKAADESGKRWTEQSNDHITGEWKLEHIESNRLQGLWSAPKGGQALSIKLERVATGQNSPCESDAYRKPRQGATTLVTGPKTSFGNKHYRLITAGQIVGVELLETGPTMAVINRQLKAQFRDDIKAGLDCKSLARESNQTEGEYELTQELVFWNERWISIGAATNYYCGGAHPDNTYHVQTFDLKTGKKVDLWSWIKKEQDELPSGLRALILEYSQADNECKEALANQFSYSIWPESEGLGFYPELPHVIAACADKIVVPFARLNPFLSKTGRSEIEALQR